MKKGGSILKSYLHPLRKVDTLILGCTHYGILKTQIAKLLPKKIQILSQNIIIRKKLSEYLFRHPEIERTLAKKRKRLFFVTEITPHIKKLRTSGLENPFAA